MKSRTASEAQTPEALLNDLRTLLSDAEMMMGDGLNANGAEAGITLRTHFAATQECVGDLFANARKMIAAGAQRSDAAIRARPYHALVIALGAGLLAGVLWNRGRP